MMAGSSAASQAAAMNVAQSQATGMSAATSQSASMNMAQSQAAQAMAARQQQVSASTQICYILYIFFQHAISFVEGQSRHYS